MIDDASSEIGESEKIRDFGEIVVHNDDVGSLDSRFGTGGAHSNADVGAPEDGRVIDTVADENRGSSFSDSLEAVKLVGWQHFSINMVDAELVADVFRDGVFVAGEHISDEAAIFEFLDSFGGAGFDLVGDGNRSDVFVVDMEVE